NERDWPRDLALVAFGNFSLKHFNAVAHHLDDIPSASSDFAVAVLLITGQRHISVVKPVMRRDSGMLIVSRRVGRPIITQLFCDLRVRRKVFLHLGIPDPWFVPSLDRVRDDGDFFEAITIE